MIKVLDKGYVHTVDVMGSDLSIVNAARASYDKESKVLLHKDEKLIQYLVKHQHDSPLRHAAMTFEVYAPLMVARQWWKHAIGSTHSEENIGWNESCLPSWQEVWSYGNKKYTVQDIVDGKNIPLRSVNSDGVIVPNRVKNIWSNGEQEVFTVTDEFGNKLSATGNHRVLTPSGYVLLADLKVGNEIGHNGVPAYADEQWLTTMSKSHTAVEIAKICKITARTVHHYKKRYGIKTDPNVGKKWTDYEWLKSHYSDQNMTLVEVASLAKCSPHTIRKWVRKFNLQKDHIKVLKDWQKQNGTFVPSKENGFARAKKSKKTRAKKYGQKQEFYGDGANYRRIALQEMGWTTCLYCSNPIGEVHHKDHNRENNSVDNLVGLCNEHHYLIHGKRPTVFGFGRIVLIESAGVWETFDIEMELESNFVAGGIVVHNSRRYVTETPTFYIPDQFSLAPDNLKQGSGEYMDFEESEKWKTMLDSFQARGEELYEQAMDAGIAPEQARLFLPAYGLYVRWRWTASLNALLNFLSLRLGHGAQNEIVEYGQAIANQVREHFPITTDAWMLYRV